MTEVPTNEYEDNVSLFKETYYYILNAIRDYVLLLDNEGRLGELLSTYVNLYSRIEARSICLAQQKPPFLPVPFIFIVKGSTVPQALCEIEQGNRSLYVALEGYKPVVIESNGRYRCTLPFAFTNSLIPATENMKYCRYFGMRVYIYLYP